MDDPKKQTPTPSGAEMSPAEESMIAHDLRESLALAKDAGRKREIVTAAFMAGEIGADELEDYLQMFGVAESTAKTRHNNATRRAMGGRTHSFRIAGQEWISN